MYFYEILVRSSRYHGSEALTYQSPQRLTRGRLVLVPLQKEQALGVVSAEVTKPAFATKAISQAYDLPPLPAQLLQLGAWLQAYYPAPLGQVMQQLLPASIGRRDEIAVPTAGRPSRDRLPTLTDQQAEVLSAIKQPGSYLLHGTTGSGKTRVYIELAGRSLAAGRSALLLTPEISLTSQLAARCREVFGEQVVVLHSQLTPKERRLAWQGNLLANRPLVVIGPRSALFSPLKDIGLIVLDEAHEPAYKQEQAPHYQAGRVAGKLAELHQAVLVLGSATPLVSDYFLAEQKAKPILALSGLARGRELPPTTVTLVDLKDRSQLSRHPYLSRQLLQAIETALGRQEQVLLYLNRRGTARIILCEQCGWQALCPHCDLPLTYHGDAHQLRCHVCNYHQTVPAACPACGHPSILFRAIGTKAVADDVAKLFPGARIQRFDTDNSKAERFEQHFEAVHRGEVDILVGTQLLAKGLDLPRLSTLGIIAADTSLAMPDFSANERTYQLLSQVLGRVGRGHIAGKAIIQTYQPDHPAIQAAINGDWQALYESELASRRQFGFPPYVYLLKLTVRRASTTSAEQAAERFADSLRQAGLKVIIEGPAPAFHEKFQNKYQWQLVLKAKDRSQLLDAIRLLPKSGWSYDIDPIDLL